MNKIINFKNEYPIAFSECADYLSQSSQIYDKNYIKIGKGLV